MKNTITLGSKVMVSDPCYGLNTWCQGVLENVKPGEYATHAVVKETDTCGKCVAEICVVHEDYEADLLTESLDFEEISDIEIGVDSGMAGIFDYEYYKIYHKMSDQWPHVDEEWYDAVCEISSRVKCQGERAGLVDRSGYVSDSGFGDGSYPCLVARNESGEIIAIQVIFIGEDYEEDADNEDYDEDGPDEDGCHECWYQDEDVEDEALAPLAEYPEDII